LGTRNFIIFNSQTTMNSGHPLNEKRAMRKEKLKWSSRNTQETKWPSADSKTQDLCHTPHYATSEPGTTKEDSSSYQSK
jgi:hypothetical protein